VRTTLAAPLPQTVGRMSQLRIFRKYLGRPYFLINRWIWNHLPVALTAWRPLHGYGRHLHRLVQVRASRRQYVGTFFFRNRPELELLVRLQNHKRPGSELKMAVLACSKGCEVYSASYALRCARPDLNIRIRALDIDRDVLEFAEEGVYSLGRPGTLTSPDPRLFETHKDVAGGTFRDQRDSIFERTAAEEMEALFDREGEVVKVKPQFREGITWHLGNAGDPDLVDVLGTQDVVIANRFLCHMQPEQAELCLRNLARLVKPSGYLFVSGVDLDVRSRVACQLGLRPVTDLIREIHDGDPSLRRDWPFEYWGLEPLDQGRSDWKTRYAVVFQR